VSRTYAQKYGRLSLAGLLLIMSVAMTGEALAEQDGTAWPLLAMGAFWVVFAARTIFTGVKVTDRGLQVRTIFRTHQITWDSVTRVRLGTTPFSRGFRVLIVDVRSRRSIAVYTISCGILPAANRSAERIANELSSLVKQEHPESVGTSAVDGDSEPAPFGHRRH
jgi:hypothetical protein